MLMIVLLALGLLIISVCLGLTEKQKKQRLLVGSVLMLFGIFCPIFLVLLTLYGLPIGLNVEVSIMVFNFMLLIGGIITVIAGLFTSSGNGNVIENTSGEK
ncbi:hypothetical protein [Bacillus suaedaesalsae]|uniref:Uncharacterized protein n=1 Tax=Bacillus suaedaesalsae TaxID=2810349 RepID=A0ABS2DHD4_9BACI|nr:hypothetical protein [Bacillus suaedaesalsae]MBM6617836.1 hypothetical protein [Bacillus suaedaesalsae]